MWRMQLLGFKPKQMLYLLWAILNTGLFVFFIVICFRATKLLREKAGLFVSIVFVFGLFSFVCNFNEKTTLPKNQINSSQFTPRDNLEINSFFHTKVTLKNNLISKHNLSISYGKSKERHSYVPINAYSHTEGFISGTNWIPHHIEVSPTGVSTQFEYSVNATTEWKLLGLTVFSNSRDYSGFVNIQ